MNKKEKYHSIKRTLKEVEYIEEIYADSDGPKVPFRETVEAQVYNVEFSNRSRGLLLDTDIVAQALKENLGRIKDSIRYLAQQLIYQAEKEALKEAEESLSLLQREIKGKEVESN